MRILLLLPLSGAMSLTACSRPAGHQPGNAVDVEAAASRAQSDIANYAAGSGHRTVRTASAAIAAAECGAGQDGAAHALTGPTALRAFALAE